MLVNPIRNAIGMYKRSSLVARPLVSVREPVRQMTSNQQLQHTIIQDPSIHQLLQVASQLSPTSNLQSHIFHNAKASPAIAARAAPPRDPATWLAPPVKWVGVGEPVVTPLVPFTAILLTRIDGQGDVSMGAALRVIILSGAAEGHEVPQGAVTVESD